MITLRYLLSLTLLLSAMSLTPLVVFATPIGADAPKCAKCCAQNLPDIPAGRGPCTDITGGSFISASHGTMGDDYHVLSTPSANGAGLDLSFYYTSYTADGSKASLNTVMGFGWSHSYNIFLFSQGRDLFKMSPGGLVTKYQRTGRDGPLNATRATQQTITQSSDGNVIDIRNNQGGLSFRFEKITGNPLRIEGTVPWMLTRITDRNGNMTTLTYQYGLLAMVQDAFGRKINFLYNGNQLVRIIDPLDRTTALSYDHSFNLASIIDPSWHVTAYEYNPRHQMITKVDKNGKRWRYAYNDAGYPSEIIDPSRKSLFNLSNPNEWAIDTDELFVNKQRIYSPSTTTRIDGRGNTWRYEYDSNAYLRNVIAPDNSMTSYRYDDVYDPANGKFATLNIASVTDANGHTTRYEYDAKGNRIKMIDALGHTTIYEYEPIFNHVTKITHANGSVTENQYDSFGNRIQEIKDVGGLNVQTNWTYDAQGNVLSQQLRNQRSPTDIVMQTTTYQYNSYGNLTKETDPEGNLTQYEYDILGNRKKVIDANDHTTTYQHDDLNRLIKITDPLGYTTEYSYDGNNNRTKIKKQISSTSYQSTTYQYDLRNRMTRQSDTLPSIPLTTFYHYDDNDNRTSITDPRGMVTHFQYDLQNRLSVVSDALSNITENLYDVVGNRIRSIDANGHYTYYQYDALNRLTREIRKIGDIAATPDSDDIVSQNIYDTGSAIPMADCLNPQCSGPIPGSSNIAHSIDPENKYRYFKYDNINRRVMTLRKVNDSTDVKDADDWAEIAQYDDVDNLLTQIDANGNANTYSYQLNNWKSSDANALAETTFYSYDGIGNLLTSTSANGNVTTNLYNPRNELINVSDSLGQIASYSYDGIGNRLTETDGNSNTTSYQYDWTSRLISVTDAMGQATTQVYDLANNLIQSTDREGRVNCYRYDDINRRTLTTQKVTDTDCAIVDSDDIWSATEYDNVGNVQRLITAKHNGSHTPANCASSTPGSECEITLYSYDAVNRLITETFPDTAQRTFSYDKSANLLSRIDQNSITTHYHYNDLYYLTQRSYPASSDSFNYDIGGRMLSASRGGWLNRFIYDGANRLLHASQNDQIISYGYNIPGRTRTVIYPSGKRITEQADLRGRLNALGEGIAIAQYTYDLGNRVTTRQYRNGVLASYSYNANNWITGLNHTAGSHLIAGFQYDYDKEGNKRYQQKLHNTTHSEAYQYDDLYRLIDYKVGSLVGASVPLPITQKQYTLDKLGNWDELTVNGNSQTRSHNTVNEITAIDGAPLSYDDNGNLTQDPLYQYNYDEENRLTQITRITDGHIIGQYHYDALSRRIIKIADLTGSPTQTRYYYDDARIIEEQDPVGTTQASYLYGNYIDEILTMERGGKIYFYHQNALWSVVAVTDSSSVVERYRYDAYGLATITDGAGAPLPAWDANRPRSAIGNPWLFTGRQLDEEAGLYFYRARHYDGFKGRFLQRDPLGYVDGMNLYSYVKGRVTHLLDPFGLICYDPPGLDLNSVNAPPIGEIGKTITVSATLGSYRGTRIQHRSQINKKNSFTFGNCCECVDAASYRIEMYEIDWNPWEWVHIHMGTVRKCCSTEPGTTLARACQGVPGGFNVDADTFEGGEASFFDPRGTTDRDLLSDVGSAASILALVIAIALPGPP